MYSRGNTAIELNSLVNVEEGKEIIHHALDY